MAQFFGYHYPQHRSPDGATGSGRSLPSGRPEAGPGGPPDDKLRESGDKPTLDCAALHPGYALR
jgi:hypothetical protein